MLGFPSSSQLRRLIFVLTSNTHRVPDVFMIEHSGNVTENPTEISTYYPLNHMPLDILTTKDVCLSVTECPFKFNTRA